MQASPHGPTTMADTPKDDCDEDLGEKPEEIARRYVEERGITTNEEGDND